ncbi:MAG: penicillin-binding protein 1C [Betaproteobacteria bacterium]|nr:MAG: penicillin-binding protein 1C [Betaproteobacteria bacterium]
MISAFALAAPPTFDSIKSNNTPSDTYLLDRNQQPLQRIRIDKTVRRSAWVSLDEVSPALIDAVLASEDKRFFDHGGVDLRAAASAAISNFAAGKAQRGASSISMQVAATFDKSLARGSDGRSVTQKFDQAQAAWELERAWSKQQILETYLNTIFFRGELQGIGAASEQLFGKSAHGLNAIESAVLAALIRAPQAQRALVERRACELLQGQSRGEDCPRIAYAIDKWGSAAALRGEHDNLAPHVAKYLSAASGGASPFVVSLSNHNGAHQASVHGSTSSPRTESNTPSPIATTTLDRDLQIAARDAINKHLQALAGRNAQDAAVVVIDNATGEVLAYVGSSGRLSQAGEVDAARAPRQAGSTLKPFIYALGFEKNLLTPATLLDDSPFSVDVGGGAYTPQNYANEYIGPVSVRTALASSLNVPAIRALTIVGVAPTHATLKRAGLTTLVNDPDHYGFSLALGSADVTLTELTNAYRAIANGGVASPIRFSPLPPGGRVREREPAPQSNLNKPHSPSPLTPPPRGEGDTRLFSESSAWLITHILADRGARYVTFGFDNPLALSHWAAVKTGTSKDMRDNWTIGFNTRVTVGVWVGNASGTPMHNVTGVSGAGPIWSDVMEAAARKYGTGRPAAMPANVVKRHIEFASPSPRGGGVRGEGACDAASIDCATKSLPPRGREQRVALSELIEPSRDEYFIRGTEPQSLLIAARQASSSGARIVSPTDGTIIAIDPDIPDAHQRITLKSGDTQHANCWEVSGESLGCSETPIAWPLRSATTDVVNIRLLDRNGEERDRIAITIRGNANVAKR